MLTRSTTPPDATDSLQSMMTTSTGFRKPWIKRAEKMNSHAPFNEGSGLEFEPIIQFQKQHHEHYQLKHNNYDDTIANSRNFSKKRQ